MGKTKTAFMSGVTEETKTSAQKYADKKAKQAAQKAEKDGVTQEVSTPDEVSTKKEAVKQTKAQKAEGVRSKNYQVAKQKINRANFYSAKDAISLLKEITNTKFDSTLEFHAIVKKQGLTAQVTLPYSFGKAKKIEVADDKTIEKLKTGKVDFDILLATPDMMPKLVMFAKLLGPRGLMPNPKNGTLIKKVSDADKFSTATLALKTEKDQPLVHVSFGKVSMKDEELAKNLETLVSAFGGTKQIIRAFIKSTMSPSVKLQIN